jgi:hypothetical protein
MNLQLTATLKNVKEVGHPSGSVIPEDGKQPYGNVKKEGKDPQG